MKTAFWLAPAILTMALSNAVLAQDMSRVAETPHNLNYGPDVWGMAPIPDGRVCMPCHTPHNAQTAADGVSSMVLWNHAVTEQDFEMYTTQAGHQGGQPEGSSKLCLSCHDGVTALDSYGGVEDYRNIRIPGFRPTNLGTDLRDDHPIGIEYPPPGLSGYHPATSFTAVKVVLINDVPRVECTSCHEPHDNSLGAFLRQTMDGSALCLECHDK